MFMKIHKKIKLFSYIRGDMFLLKWRKHDLDFINRIFRFKIYIDLIYFVSGNSCYIEKLN